MPRIVAAYVYGKQLNVALHIHTYITNETRTASLWRVWRSQLSSSSSSSDVIVANALPTSVKSVVCSSVCLKQRWC
jgi:hypothetical protein